MGADGVELDVRLSGDGALVVHHDAGIAGLGAIAEVKTADLPPWVPLLGAVLDVCGPMIVNIEIKNIPGQAHWDPQESVANMVAVLLGERTGLGPVMVSSFSMSVIDAVLGVDPSIPTGWLTRISYDQDAALASVIEHGHSALVVPGDAIGSSMVERSHSQGVKVWAWTVDVASEMAEMARSGVDAIITNEVAEAMRVFRRD